MGILVTAQPSVPSQFSTSPQPFPNRILRKKIQYCIKARPKERLTCVFLEGKIITMSDGSPYTRAELESHPDTFPERGLLCPRCKVIIPQFAELRDSDAYRIKLLISQGQKLLAMAELEAATGCSKRFAKIWVLHSGRPHAVGTTAPCPYCGSNLVTALAKQCQTCFMDWHDPSRPYDLRTKKLI